MLDPDRPIYDRAPLKLVAFQLRFAPVHELDAVSPPREIVVGLRERYPILGTPPEVQVDFLPGSTQQRTRGSRFLNRAKTWSISLTGDAIAIETSRYTRYEKFAEHVRWVLDRVHAVTPFPAVLRVGLRYIDEIEVDGVDALDEWKPWITNDLLVGGLIGGYRTREYLAHANVEIDDFSGMTVRYGRVDQPVVSTAGPLRINESPTGPYFLLDIDSFWQPSDDAFLEYDAAEVETTMLALHDPIREVFEGAVTPQLLARFHDPRTA
ncbi:MAG: TIGR04255 family protein [Solirubrobacteraceae bacterium]